MEMNALWTTDQLAGFLNCERRTIYYLARQKKIPFFRIGKALRFDPREIVTHLKDTQKNLNGRRQDTLFDAKGALSGLSV